MLPSQSFAGVARRALSQSQVGVRLSVSRRLLIFPQAVRRYASAAPTAAFAGQKGSNVRPFIFPFPSTNSDLTPLLG
jgi:hypothetical protein